MRETCDIVHDYYAEARAHNLQIEVIVWALKAMKENSTLTIEEAFINGFKEWLK